MSTIQNASRLAPGDIFYTKKNHYTQKVFFFPFSGIRAFLEKILSQFEFTLNKSFGISFSDPWSLAFRVQIPRLWHFVFRSLGHTMLTLT